jgi:hypothetical protein
MSRMSKTANQYWRACLGSVTLSMLASCSTVPGTTIADSNSRPVAQPSAASCVPDRAALLALDMAKFDQDLDGGWRVVAKRNGCLNAAADLIRDYHAALSEKSFLLYWHEGQARAINGDYAAAEPLFEMSYNTQNDTIGWNLYVDATLAFIRRDKAALTKAWFALANLPPPANVQLDQNGNSPADSWPPNLDVVEDLLACFDQQYTEAYQNCRS